MRIFEGNDLREDFFYQVKRYLATHSSTSSDPTADAVFAILGRPLTVQDRKSIFGAIDVGTLLQSAQEITRQAQSAGTA